MASSVLNHDLPCSKCSYNLRGLGRAHRCPECGCFVADSIDRFFKLAAGKGIRGAVRLNRIDKFCAILAMALGAAFVLLGVVGLFAGCSASFVLPPVLGILPALVGWGILRSVWVAWLGGKIRPADIPITKPAVGNLSIYRDPIPTLPEDIDKEVERLGEPGPPFGPSEEIPSNEMGEVELDEKLLNPEGDASP